MKKSTNVTTEQNATNELVNEIMGKLNKLPQIQTKHINKIFGMNDGGKFLRRHLRKYFTTNMSHEWGNNWTWNNENNKILVEIVTYFVNDVKILDIEKRKKMDYVEQNFDFMGVTL